MMETKTIRFEEGGKFSSDELTPYFDGDIPPNMCFDYSVKAFVVKKSFTVTITITEDGE